MTQKQEDKKKVPFSGRIHLRTRQELEWLADWHGSSLTWIHEQAIHEKALRDLPGLKGTGVVQTKKQTEAEREEQLV